MKFENELPQGFNRKAEAEIGRTKPLRSPAARFGQKTAGETPFSKVEDFFARDWAPMHDVRILGKEALGLAITGGATYTPDFLVATEDGIALVEVKSENPLPNEERAIAAFTDASRRNPQIEFWWARQYGMTFNIQVWRAGKCESR